MWKSTSVEASYYVYVGRNLNMCVCDITIQWHLLLPSKCPPPQRIGRLPQILQTIANAICHYNCWHSDIMLVCPCHLAGCTCHCSGKHIVLRQYVTTQFIQICCVAR